MHVPLRTLAALAVFMMVLPSLALGAPGAGDGQADEGDSHVDAPPVGRGAGIEPAAITPDAYEDHFTSLLPWPTNRTLYTIEWRPSNEPPGGPYALIAGSGGSLFKYTQTGQVTSIYTGTEESLYDVAWTWNGTKALVTGNHSTLLLWDAEAEELDSIDVPYDQRFLGATWDREGEVALIVGDGGFVGRFNGTWVEQLPSGLSDYIYRVEWWWDEGYALAVGDNGLLVTINTTEVVKSTRLNTSWGLWRLEIAPRGQYALIAGRNYAFVTPRALIVRYNASGTFDEIPIEGSPTRGLRAVSLSESDVGEISGVMVGLNSTWVTYSDQWGNITARVLTAPGDRTFRGCALDLVELSHQFTVVGNRGLIWYYNGTWSNRSYDPQEYVHSIAWRPQGDYGLAVGRGGFMARVSVSGWREIDSGVVTDLYDVDWASDGTFALACGEAGRVLRYNHGATTAGSIRTGVLALHGISVKPGESTALAVGDAGQVWLWSGGTWQDRKLLTDSRNLRDVAWKPNGAFAIIVGVSGAMLNFTGGRTDSFTPQPLTYAPFFSVAWSSDGKRAMAVGGVDGTSSLDTIWVYDNVDWLQVAASERVPYYGCAFTGDNEVGVAFGADDVIVKFNVKVGDGVRSSFRSLYTILQRGCTIPGERAVAFVGARGYAYRMDVAQFPNSPPTAVIAAPRTGTTFNVGETVELNATGSDDPDNDPLTFTWTSNVTGELGTGRVLEVIIDDEGWHRITLTVDDGKGHSVSEFVIIKFVVPNYPPVPVINSPLEGGVYTNEDLIVFDANGTEDPNGDPVTYSWVSTLSGDIGSTERVERALPVGAHRIVLWVEDDKGERASVDVNITVVQANRPPVVYITSPLEGEAFDEGETIELNASYSLDPDGDPLSFFWESDDNLLGSGRVVLLVLPVGTHHIILTVTDDHGHVVTSTVNVTVEAPVDLPPTVTVSSPASNSTVRGTVTVRGLVADPEGGAVTVRYAISRPEGWQNATVIGSGWSFPWDTTTISNGQYSVFVEADDGTNTKRVWVQYFVDNFEPVNSPPTVELVAPAPGTVKGVVTLEGLASDPDGDAIVEVQVRVDSGPWTPASGTAAWTFSWDTRDYSNGAHTLSVRSSDGDLWSEVETYQFTLDNPDVGGGDGGGSAWLWMVVAIVVVVVVVALLLFLRGPRRSSPR